MERFFVLVCLLAGLLCGCSGEKVDSPGEEEELAMAGSQLVEPVMETREYSLLIRDGQYTLSLYEPREGCYIGAFIEDSKRVDGEISSFEDTVGVPHALYGYRMKLGDPFPVQFVLSCISQMKTPYIILEPPNSYAPFDTMELERVAKEFGEFYVPIFVDFYPNPEVYGWNPDVYTDFYRTARSFFKAYASNTAFVWSVSEEEAITSDRYYPSDAFCDWIGLSFFRSINTNDESMASSIDLIEPFYYLYQHRKPLIIQVGISHYSSVDHGYYTKEAIEDIESLYQGLATEYTRIKGILYTDYNAIDFSFDKATGDDYSITTNEQVLSGYREAVENDYFLAMLDYASTGELQEQLLKSPFKVLAVGDGYYISQYCLEEEFGMANLSRIGEEDRIVVDDTAYYNMDALEDKRFNDLTVNETGKNIIIK